VFAVEPKVRKFKTGRGDVFLRAIQIRSARTFGGEEKPSALVVRFYGILQNSASMKDISSFHSSVSS
jgi:hypothetical protein